MLSQNAPTVHQTTTFTNPQQIPPQKNRLAAARSSSHQPLVRGPRAVVSLESLLHRVRRFLCAAAVARSWQRTLIRQASTRHKHDSYQINLRLDIPNTPHITAGVVAGPTPTPPTPMRSSRPYARLPLAAAAAAATPAALLLLVLLLLAAGGTEARVGGVLGRTLRRPLAARPQAAAGFVAPGKAGAAGVGPAGLVRCVCVDGSMGIDCVAHTNPSAHHHPKTHTRARPRPQTTTTAAAAPAGGSGGWRCEQPPSRSPTRNQTSPRTW